MSNQRTGSKLHWWQRKEIIIAFAIIGTLVLIAVLIFAVHTYHLDLATTTTTEVTKSPQEKMATTETGKTILDWLQLLGVIAIPIVVGFGTIFFTRQQAKTSEANAENQRQEELLRNYFDKISDLLLDEKLSSNPNIQSIVRARTLAALHRLTIERKAIVLRFLHDTALLQHVKSFIYSPDLNHTDLNRIDLSGANLSDANLCGANLVHANLSDANLSRTGITPEQLEKAKNITPEQLKEASKITPMQWYAERLAQIALSKPAVPQEAKTAKTSTIPIQSEVKPDQASQEEAKQKEPEQPKQDADASH